MIARLPVGRRILVSLLAIAAGVMLIVLLGVPASLGAFTARITNSGDTASNNPYFTCAAAVGKAGDAAWAAYAMDDTLSVTMADDSGNNRAGGYSLLGVTLNQPGPCGRDNGLSANFNGVNGSAYGPTTTLNTGTSFTEEIWFKTTTGGGKLLGFGNARTGASTQYDRHIYLTNAGNVVFGVYPGTVKTVVSPATYLDGKWHHVIATQGPATNANPGIRLYVDGALVASDATVVTNENASDYIRIGYDNLNSWGTTQPSNFYFTGNLAWAAVYLTTFTPTQVRYHYAAGS